MNAPEGLWLKDPGSPPEQGFQYPAIAGPNLRSYSFSTLCGFVEQHYRANARPIPTCDEVLKWVCENQQVSCYEGRSVYRNQFTDPPSYAQRGLKGPNWPLLLQPLKLLAKGGDRGLGDIIERVVGPIGGEAYKKWHLKIFGTSCSCSERRDSLNVDFPL